MGLMYQPGVLKKYNLPVPTTWAEFASDAVALHKADPSMYLDLLRPQRRRRPGVAVLAGRGTPYTVEANGTWKIDLNGPIEQKVIDFWGNLVKEGAVAVDPTSPPTGGTTSVLTGTPPWSARAGRRPTWSTRTCRQGPPSSGP